MNEQILKRKPGRPHGSVQLTQEAIREDHARMQPTIDRFLAAVEAGISVKVIASRAGIDYFRANQTSAKMGRYYGTGKRHISFTDAELAAINAAIDEIRDSLGGESCNCGDSGSEQ